jgi:hypothetical protein
VHGPIIGHTPSINQSINQLPYKLFHFSSGILSRPTFLKFLSMTTVLSSTVKLVKLYLTYSERENSLFLQDKGLYAFVFVFVSVPNNNWSPHAFVESTSVWTKRLVVNEACREKAILSFSHNDKTPSTKSLVHKLHVYTSSFFITSGDTVHYGLIFIFIYFIYSLFSDALSDTHTSLYSVEWSIICEWWIVKNMEGSGRGLI